MLITDQNYEEAFCTVPLPCSTAMENQCHVSQKQAFLIMVSRWLQSNTNNQLRSQGILLYCSTAPALQQCYERTMLQESLLHEPRWLHAILTTSQGNEANSCVVVPGQLYGEVVQCRGSKEVLFTVTTRLLHRKAMNSLDHNVMFIMV